MHSNISVGVLDEFTIDTTELSVGNHDLELAITTSAGQVASLNLGFAGELNVSYYTLLFCPMGCMVCNK